MQGSPSFLTVKQVATALGIDERSVRDKLTIGTLKGTKRTVGNKEQWFIHQRDLDAELARRGISINQQRATRSPVSFSNQPFDASPSFESNANLNQTLPEPTFTSAGDEAEVVTDIEAEVTEAPEVDKETSAGERPSWSNEDMRKQLIATAEVFMKPLVDRIEALTAADKEKDVLLQAKEQELEEARKQLKLLPDLEAQKARLLKEIEAEREAAELQFAKAREQEEESKKLFEENEQLKQKAEEATLSLEKLQMIEKQMEILRRPWWKKWFLPQPEETSQTK